MPMGSKDTNSVGRVADIFYDAPANELYLADGYGNHRVMVVDADSLAFKRHVGRLSANRHPTRNCRCTRRRHSNSPIRCIA
jgi:hypothetical protein